ncbi:MAG: mechanosensitive ion channel family protein [Alcanivoracaceae bacterium]|nr:mechanosensitive ion channel family protein [Alcanivoracaceae bacterium]
MEPYLVRLAISAVTVVTIWLVNWLLKRLSRRIASKQGYASARAHQIKVILNTSAWLLAVLLLAAIWGFEQNLVVFASSIFALVGVALFASWSMLSNITAAVIIFFSAPFRIGDRIRVLDGDNTLTGQIRHIGLIYMELNDEDGHLYLLPNNVLLQKTSIRLKPGKDLPCDSKHARS